MPTTDPERIDYARHRIEHLTSKIESLQRLLATTKNQRNLTLAIQSSERARRRWRRVLNGADIIKRSFRNMRINDDNPSPSQQATPCDSNRTDAAYGATKDTIPPN